MYTIEVFDVRTTFISFTVGYNDDQVKRLSIQSLSDFGVSDFLRFVLVGADSAEIVDGKVGFVEEELRPFHLWAFFHRCARPLWLIALI